MAALLLLAIAPAHALAPGTLELQDNFDGTFALVFTGGANEANEMTITANGGSIVVTDTAAVIDESAAECTGDGTNTVTCTQPGLAFIMATLGDGDDRFQLDAPLESFGPGIDGGIGNDRLIGGPVHDFLRGEAGGDEIDGRGGSDALNGGGGDLLPDQVRGGSGADSFNFSQQDGADLLIGGPGIDEVIVTESFLVPGYRYTLGDGLANDGFGDQRANLLEIEDITGHEGTAIVRRTADPNVATTFNGDDDIDLLGGPDKIDAGSQNDTVEARDGFSDRVQCGSGTDTVRADQLDELSGCENVTRTFVPPFGRPAQSPAPPTGPAPLALAGCGPGRTLIALGAGNDTRNGTPRADLVPAGAGNDVIDALAGNDCIDLGREMTAGRAAPGTTWSSAVRAPTPRAAPRAATSCAETRATTG